MSSTEVFYHRRTEYRRDRLGGGYLDWSRRPSVFKTYRDVPLVSLPEDIGAQDVPFWEVFRDPEESPSRTLDLKQLARILHLSCGITGRAVSGREVHYFRSVPSAGALYPCEVYVTVRGVEGLDDGLYHFDLAHNRLAALRQGESQGRGDGWRVVLFVTVLFFRTAWKYRDRAYRYCLLDAGHLVENAALVIRSEGHAPTVFDCFDDGAVNRFLGIDPSREACLGGVVFSGPLTAVGERNASKRIFVLPSETDLSTFHPNTSDAARVVSMEAVPESVLDAHESTASWTIPEGDGDTPVPLFRKTEADAAVEFPVRGAEFRPEGPSFAQVVWNRRSQRNFVRRSVPPSSWSLLWRALETGPQVFGDLETIVCCTDDVEGMDAGVYLWDAASNRMKRFGAGDVQEEMAKACLNQEWLKNAVFLVTYCGNLDSILDRWGPRGYRMAMLQSGRFGQRLYLAATALGWGACGIGAYFDEEVRKVLGLKDAADVFYVMACGPVKKPWFDPNR